MGEAKALAARKAMMVAAVNCILSVLDDKVLEEGIDQVR